MLFPFPAVTTDLSTVQQSSPCRQGYNQGYLRQFLTLKITLLC